MRWKIDPCSSLSCGIISARKHFILFFVGESHA